MSDISKYTSRFRINGAGSQDPAVRKVTKRPRESLACNQCRTSKLRCDKGKPCGSCLKKDGGASCSYQRQSISEGNSRSAAEERLDRLESMVTKMMQTQQSSTAAFQTQPTTPPDVVGDPTSVVDHIVNDDAGKYPTVLEDIMNSINELKVALPSMSEELDGVSLDLQPDLSVERIFGSSSAHSVQQILSMYLPPKVEADRLVAIYFRGDTFIQPFIHATHFRRQYQDFWKDTSKISPIWLSILFSIFNMSSMARNAAKLSPGPTDHASNDLAFHAAAGECLVLGQYHRAQRYVAEALILYAHSISLKSLDPSRETGVVISMAVRIAYEMGYHRDPDVFGTFSVFEGEMRRRFWAVCKQVDTMVAFQLGLPSNIRLENCDTKSPRNLLDSDFGPESDVLPPSRPESEITPLLWFLVKNRLMPGFTRVCQDALSLLPKSEQDVKELDEEIRSVHATVPDVLRARPISESNTDSRFLVMARFYIELLHLKSLCILHRKNMTRGSFYSTRKCIEAGLEIVRMFIDAYKEFSPGGKLYDVRWMFNSYYMSDFLLGVIVVCLYVNISRRKGVDKDLPGIGVGSEIFTLLEQSHAVCIDKFSASKDARKVSLAIRLALEAGDEPSRHEQSRVSDQSWLPNTTLNSQSLTTEGSRREDLDWFTPPSTVEHSAMHGVSFGALDPFNFMSTEPIDFESAFANVGTSMWEQNMFPPEE